MDSEIRNRLSQYLECKHISKSDFGRKIGASSAFVTSIKKSISPDKLQAISLKFSDLNIEWLMLGVGDMINTNVEKTKIPFYEATSVGGRDVEAALNPVSQPTSYIDTGDWFKNATAAMRHTGHSMVQYPKGCILALKEVYDRELIIPGRDYVVETDEYRVTKQIQLLRDGYYTAYSTNVETYPDGHLIHPPFDIPIKKVRHILLVLGYVVNENGNTIFHSNNKI